MNTIKNPYLKKIGLNLANLYFINIGGKNANDYLNLIFRTNEREAIGRRILIIIYILEGYGLESIVNSLKCGFNTINEVKKSLDSYTGNKKVLLQNLRELYYSQFLKTNNYSYSPKTVKGAMKILGISEAEEPKNTPVRLLGNNK